MAITITRPSGSKPATIKVPATPRVTSTIKAPVHDQRGTQNPAHCHVKLPNDWRPQ